MGWQRTATFSGHKGAVYALCKGADADHFFSAGGDGQVVSWSIADPTNGVLIARTERAIFSMARAINGDLLLGDEDGGLHRLDLTTNQEVRLVREHTKGIFSICPLRDGRLVCAGGDGVLSIWHVTIGQLEQQRRIPLMDEKLRYIALDPSGTQLAVAGGDGSVRVFDTKDFNETLTFSGQEHGASCVAWHPVKPVIISGGKDGHLRIWHALGASSELMNFTAHASTVYAMEFVDDGKCCATAGRDGIVRLWDTGNFGALERLVPGSGRDRSVNALMWHHGKLFSAGDGRLIHAWERS